MTGAAVLAGLWLAAASMPAGPQQPMAVQPQAGAGPEIVLPPRVGVEGGQPLRLTLAEAIRLTLEQNNDVVIARLEVDAARQDIRAAEGVFDPRVLPAFSFQRTVSANTSAIGGAVNGRLEQDALAGGLGMEGRTP